MVAIGDGEFDGALLKIVGDIDNKPIYESFKPVPLGNSNTISQGEKLCVFGFPAQVEGSNYEQVLKDMSTLSVGIMSGYDYVMNSDYGYIKTDAEIHGGNSGGPVFDESNKVVGIATAYGKKTGIGLVGGINGMYYVSAIDNSAHSQLVDLGLQLPSRSSSINTITGNRQKVKTPTEINAIINARNSKETNKISLNNNTYDHYTKSKVFFSNVSVKENYNLLPSASKRYNTFNVANGKNVIWIYVTNSPNKLMTNSLKVKVYKADYSGKYNFQKDINVSQVNSNDYYTHFSQKFPYSGSYKLVVYNSAGKYINTGYFKTVIE